jgi:outer membrane protein assembly factor BamB
MNPIHSSRTILACLLLAFFLPAAPAQDWPQWRGPNRDGKAGGFAAPKVWPKTLTQQWKITVGNGDATPALVGDKLYVFTREGENEVIRCLDAGTGKEKWKDAYPSQPATSPAGGPHAGPRCSPTVADGKVLTLGVRGTLSCIDAATGAKIWRKDDFKGEYPKFFTSSSPIVVDGLCIAQLGGPKSGGIVAYDLASGEQKWKWTGDGPGYASPELMDVGGTKLIIALTDSKVVAITAADGKQVWEAPFMAARMNYNASTPVVAGQTIFYGGGGRGEKAVKFEKEGDRFVAKELWSNPKESVQFNTPVLKGSTLFGLTQDNQLFAINAESGATDWSAPVGQPAGGGQQPGRGGRSRSRGGYGEIVDADTVLLALTPTSELIVFEPNDKKYIELARFKVAATPTYTYPVVSGNRVYIKDEDSLTLWTIESPARQ